MTKFPRGGRVFISTTITDAATGQAPAPLSSKVEVTIYRPDSTGYTALTPITMDDDGPDADGGQAYSCVFATDETIEGAYKTQIEWSYQDGSKDRGNREVSFW